MSAQSFVNDQETDFYCSPSGMIGGRNPAGFWYMFKPPVSANFISTYAGATHQVSNMGDGTYLYALNNGSTRRLQYAPHFVDGAYYDASGARVNAPDAARVAGDPSGVFFQQGPVAGSNAQNTQVTQTAASNGSTRSSDGRTDVWAGASGMAGVFKPGGSWVVFVPTAGLVIESIYGGETTRVVNNGDGTYSLSINGQTSRRAYDPKWLSATYFDARGNPVASAGAATAPGDPVVFYTPGPIVSDATVRTSTLTTPPPPTLTTLPPASTYTDPGPMPPAGGGGGGVPSVVAFPTAPADTSLPTDKPSILPVALAIGAALLFS